MPTEGNAITISGDDDKDKAVNFFNDVIENWKPASDQSDLDKLNKCDLQIGMANISSTASSIDFNMTHAMGLADITLGKGLNYELSDKTYDWTSAIVSDQFVDNVPYELSYNRYVSIVKPNTSTNFNATAKGWKGAWKNALSYSPSIAEIEKLTAERSTDVNQAYTLALGDIYYSNGAVTHSSDDLEPAEANTPIGVVGYIGNNQWTEASVSGKGGHALVIGLKSTSGIWYPSNTNVNHAKPNTGDLVRASYNQSWGSGYNETLSYINSGGSAFAAAYQARNYSELPAKSSKCTGWFLPSAGQYYAILSQLGGGLSPNNWNVDTWFSNAKTVSIKINAALSRVGANNYSNFFQTNGREWTSSEGTNTTALAVDSGIDDNMGIGSFRFMAYIKNGGSSIRPFLAF